MLRRYIDELSVTGLTSNPTVFGHAIKNSNFYDNAIRQKVNEGKAGEELFFELALEDMTQAADLFRPVYDQTGNATMQLMKCRAYNLRDVRFRRIQGGYLRLTVVAGLACRRRA